MELVNFELIKKLRNHINRTEKQAELLTNRKKWLQVTSALDVLEDTSWAIEYYVEQDYPDDMKGKYLYTYGVLQALFVQQDAINSINQALFDEVINFKEKYPEIYNVREMRDDVVGHPTSRRNKQFIHLAQCSMSKEGFYYIKNDSETEDFEVITVSVTDAIGDVANNINSILQKAVDDLDSEFQEYIDKHKDRKMKEIFSQLGYAKAKVLNKEHMSDWGYEATKNMVKRCEEELVLRYGSVDAFDTYKFLLDEIHEIYDLLENDISDISSENRDNIEKYLLQILFVKLEDLESYCEETDEYFENRVEEPVSDGEDVDISFIFGEENLSE